MKCAEPVDAGVNATRSDMQLYQEALSCMELIASKLENDTDYPVVDHLYEKCNAVIGTLRNSQPNPHISTSLENLLETLSFQKSLLDSRRNGYEQDRRRTVSEGPFKYSSYSKKAPEKNMQQNSSDTHKETNRCATVQDMLVPCGVEGGSMDDVAGLSEVKQILQEAVIMPTHYPQLFQGGAKPWTRLLLYGPPGTGKTKLARSLASELHCPFYCVSSASLLSSWIGESEKVIRDLFQHAREQPGQSFIFMDEIDSLCRKRSQTEDEHSRRVKSELLRQIDGIEENKKTVFLMGATNCPWDLDPAFLRRFQRRIYVPLPDREGRRTIISKQFSAVPLKLTDSEWLNILDVTEGYSGADLTHLVMAAAFQPIRDLQSSRFWKFTYDNKITPCSSDTLGAMQYPLSKLPADQVVARDVQMKDFLLAIQTTPRTVSPKIIQQYQVFSSAVHHT